MPQKSSMRCAMLAAALAAAALAGCGRRGPLEPPPDVSATAKPADSQSPPAGGAANAAPARPKGPTPPHQPFILDPLL